MYVIDCDDLYEMYKVGKPEGELDLFIEHDCSEHIPGRYLTSSKQEDRDEDCRYDGGNESEKEDADEDCGYDDGGNESEKEDAEYSDDDVERPREEEEAEESEDETSREDNVAKENVCGEGGETEANEREEIVANERGKAVAKEGGEHVVDDGSDVVADAGNCTSDARFKSLFEEGTKTVPEKEAFINHEEKTAAEREAEESEEVFGIGEKEYPDTPLESNEEWDQWDKLTRPNGKGKFHGDLQKEPYLWLFHKFNSGLEFKDQLLRYALKTQFDVKMAKSEANRNVVIFRVFCSYERL